jgi:hypothetical protein
MVSWFKLSHSRYLLISLFLSYLGFIYWQGIRVIVIVSGAFILGLALFAWAKQLQRLKHHNTNSQTKVPSLLQAGDFAQIINALARRIPQTSYPLWQPIQQQAQKISSLTIAIAQKEPTFIPDLLETLHTVIALVKQLSEILQVIGSVHTSHYQASVQHQLQHSQARLQQTQDQLQAFHDQIVVEQLDQHSAQINFSVLSDRLRALISENTSSILEN